MAAAEARAAWQRTANRCFVQEDAKRAPKVTCCSSSSSSSSSKVQSDVSGCDACNGSDHAAATFMPLNWNTSNSSLPADTRWWLQLQPNFACPKDFSREKLNALDAKLEGMTNGGDTITTSKPDGDSLPVEVTQVELNKSPCSSLESHCRVSIPCMKHDSEARVQELKAVNSNVHQSLKHKVGEDELWCQYEEFMDWKPVDQWTSDEKACFDLGITWMESDKTEPWWRTADKDELASLVVQKSLEHIENCDLPPPQTIHVRKGPLAGLESFNHDGILSSSLDRSTHADLCNQVDCVQHSPASQSMDGKHWPCKEACHLSYGSDKTCSGTNSYNTTIKDSTEGRPSAENNANKAQLLEALRHSQTRAREAEKAAQQAYTDKEHIIKLFFRQASHLFAYKQWLQLLQLENLLLQLKMRDNQKISTLLPGLPWRPLNSKQLRRGVHEVRKGNNQNHGFSKCAVAVMVGLGLAGAGLLLGWTMGWMLPSF